MNVIVICLDTLRWDFLGCYGVNQWVRTQLIDSYAQSATRFDMAFCGSFPTVPHRVDVYTGDVNWPRYGWKGLDADQPALPSMLRNAGYHAALVLDTRNNVGAGLHEFYDEHHLIDKPPTNTVRPEDITFPVPRENMRQNGNGYANDRARTAHYVHETDWFVARTMTRACEWLEDNHRRERFFLWVDTFEIHEDWRAPDFYTEMYSPGYKGLDYSYPNYGYTDIYKKHELERMRARYAAEVTLTDRWVGHLLRQIDYLGLFDNTMVILTSDHGMYLGEHGRTGKHTVDENDPWPLYDEVARVPLLVWMPWKGAPRRTRALVQAADITATVLDACGVRAAVPVGRTFVPLLKGRARTHRDAVFTSCHSWDGPGRIKYLPSLITVTTPRWSLVVGPAPHKPELYDRRTDPAQKRNVARRHPQVVDRLRSALAGFMAAQGAKPQYVSTYALRDG